MLKNIRKYLEYFFFILVNIFLLGPVYGLIIKFFSFLAYIIASEIFHVSEDIIIQDDPTFFIFFIAFSLSLFILKPIFFQIIYIFNNKFFNIHKIFDKLRKEKNFLFFVLFIAFSLDLTCFILTKNLFTLLFGLLFNYFTFLISFNPYKEFNSKTEPKDKINKILVFSMLGISIFIFISPLLLFFIFFALDIIANIF